MNRAAPILIQSLVGKLAFIQPSVYYVYVPALPKNGMRREKGAGKTMDFSSAGFQHKYIHEATWVSPVQQTRNQPDYLVTDRKHSSSVMDVIRGTNTDSFHYVVKATVRTRLSRAKVAQNQIHRKLGIGKRRLPEPMFYL